jgi:hypothetical protein
MVCEITIWYTGKALKSSETGGESVYEQFKSRYIKTLVGRCNENESKWRGSSRKQNQQGAPGAVDSVTGRSMSPKNDATTHLAHFESRISVFVHGEMAGKSRSNQKIPLGGRIFVISWSVYCT